MNLPDECIALYKDPSKIPRGIGYQVPLKGVEGGGDLVPDSRWRLLQDGRRVKSAVVVAGPPVQSTRTPFPLRS